MVLTPELCTYWFCSAQAQGLGQGTPSCQCQVPRPGLVQGSGRLCSAHRFPSRHRTKPTPGRQHVGTLCTP